MSDDVALEAVELMKQMHAEIERLRLERDGLRSGHAMAERNEARLTAALRAIEPLTQTCYEAAEIARAALEGKP